MEEKRKTKIESKVSDFIEGLQFHNEKKELFFLIVKDKNGDGIMRFEGFNTNLAFCFADFIRQQPELAKIMIAALCVTGYIGEDSATDMARMDYKEYKEEKS